ncbi:AAA family ATPase [Gallaecimonas pentaromativorans]|uniref:AAA family ATPase n=1 Tax=Gallaecimonas pentaromativorans TaxID=584787 RepID=UPI003A8CD402
MPHPQLHLFCGTIGSGKSTLAHRIAAEQRALLLSEDKWLANLYGPQMTSLADYAAFAPRLKAALFEHLVALLKAGNTLVLDFPMNTRQSRAWAQQLIAAANTGHQLHCLDVPEAICLERLLARNRRAEHPFAPSAEQFAAVCRYFEPPGSDEGFVLCHHPWANSGQGAHKASS